MQAQKRMIRIVATSDTHDKHKHIDIKDMPPGDIFIHAGDFTRMSRLKEYQKFRTFLKALPYKHKIVIPGNHDFALQCIPEKYKELNQIFRVKPKEVVDPHQQLQKLKEVCTFLHHQAVQIQGLKIFGSPYVISTKTMGFGYPPEQGDKIWSNLPQNIDILVTHGPPFGLHDKSIHTNQNCGCKFLLEKVKQIQPKYHIFGHIHQGNGNTKIDKTHFYNVAYMDQKYSPKNKPIVIDIQVDEK